MAKTAEKNNNPAILRLYFMFKTFRKLNHFQDYQPVDCANK
jgi:hypothetical protein